MRIIKIAWRYIKRYPMLSLATISSIIISSFFEGASFGMLIPLIQSFTAQTGSVLRKIPFVRDMQLPFSSMSQKEVLSFILIALLLMMLAKNVFTYLSNVLTARLRFRLIRDLSTSLMDRIIEYDIRFFDNMKTGHLVTSLNTETNRIGIFMLGIMRFVATFCKVVAYVAVLCLISLKITAAMMAAVILILLPLEFIMKKLKKLGKKISEAVSDYNYKLLEILNGIRVIRANTTEESEKEKFRTVAQRMYDHNYKSNRLIYLLIPVSEVATFGVIVIGLLVLLYAVKIETASAFPFIATYLVVLVRALTQLNLLNTMRSDAVNNLAAVSNYESLYDRSDKQTIIDGKKALRRFAGAIEFRNVNFSYTAEKQVLKNVNFSMPKGKITALVGMSGAGKSTIVNLILRFYDAGSGQVLVEGYDLKDIAIKDWRRRIGLVSQDIFLFNTTVRENVSYGRDSVREEDIVNACKKAFAHDFIRRMPQGYDTILGERGVKLSGGQKQRLSIARAIIHDPEILILDEATSSLDTETERMITEAIGNLTKNRTVIAIAHRLSTIIGADNIIVLSNGEIAETGTHSDLILRNGLYRKLYEAQFGIQNTAQINADMRY